MRHGAEASRCADRRRVAAQPAEREADPFAVQRGLFRDAVDVVDLGRSAHDQQAAVDEGESDAWAVGLAPRLQDETAGGTQRKRGHHGIVPQLGLVVGVEPHAVAPVAITVGQNVVEGDARPLADSRQQGCDGGSERARLEGLARVAIAQVAGPGDQPRLHHRATEQHDGALLPGELAAQGREGRVGFRGRKPAAFQIQPGTMGERGARGRHDQELHPGHGAHPEGFSRGEPRAERPLSRWIIGRRPRAGGSAAGARLGQPPPTRWRIGA